MTLPTPADIDALLAFLPGFYQPGRRFTREPESVSGLGPVFDYDHDVTAFFRIAGTGCWVDQDYDPQQATSLLNDAPAIATADLPTLRTLITACTRGEKFCDGWWASLLREGKLQAVLQRLAILRETLVAEQDSDTVESLFARWRTASGRPMDWGLAWYLSREICHRYYRSHGIAPFVINHDGLGYYGIELTQLPCSSTGHSEHLVLGRMSMAGNVENWITGSPGDHGCDLFDVCNSGTVAEELVSRAIRHLRLPPIPAKPHNQCHHKRRGDSFVLLWEIATILALRADLGESDLYLVANGLKSGQPFVGLDGPPVTYRKPAHFCFSGNRDIYVSDEGALCDGSGHNLWLRYMAGESPALLASWLQEYAMESGHPNNKKELYR